MLCDLPCPYLGMHQTLEAFACWQRNESCSLSPAPSSCSRTGLQQDAAFGAFRADLANLQQMPRTTSPARHPGFTCPLKATIVSRTGNRAGQGPSEHRGWACARVQVHTERGSVLPKNQTPPSKRNLAGMSIMTNAADQEPEPVSSTCILKAFTPIFWCILLIWDTKSSTLSWFFSM